MAFTPAFKASESEDGKTVTFTLTAFDGSIEANDDFSKEDFTPISIVLTDAYGEDLETLDFLTVDEVVYNKTTDLWINATLFMSSEGEDYEVTHSYPTKQISQTKLAQVLYGNKCCGKYGENYALGLGYLLGARNDQYIDGNEVKYQRDVDNANAYFSALI